MTRKVDMNVEAAAQILGAIGCADDPILVGGTRGRGIPRGLKTVPVDGDGVVSPSWIADSAVWSMDAKKVWIAFNSGGRARVGSVFDMVMDRLDAVPRSKERGLKERGLQRTSSAKPEARRAR